VQLNTENQPTVNSSEEIYNLAMISIVKYYDEQVSKGIHRRQLIHSNHFASIRNFIQFFNEYL
jgi:hypothetical protein